MNESDFKGFRLLAAAILPSIAGTIVVFIGSVMLQEYGWILFLMLPVVIGFTSTVIYDPNHEESFWKCLLVALLSIVVIGFLIMVTAIEGLVCLAMALPLALPLIAVGVAIGWTMTSQWQNNRRTGGLSVLLFLVMPLLMGFEASNKSTPTIHEVVSTIEIDAPIETVWKNVIEFPQIDEEPTGILALGFAYPINAKIEGTGIGAIRNCNFNTGPFVEPITAWQEPTLLTFDVAEQPSPMVELSFYDELHAAHLDYIRSRKGQFRLYEKDGKTIVEGTTLYTHEIAPDIYWRLYSDEIIHRIHMRVLEQIKKVSERSK
jgi:hypothetical protein